MPNLPDKQNCCACAACVDICPKGALFMKEDKNGFYSISIDSSKCIDCGLCEKRCHILNGDKLSWSNAQSVSPKAGWSTKSDLISRSASGAIFAQVAYNFLEEGNTFVYGASLLSDNTVRHIEISKVSEIPLLQNSKYQQSYTVGVYKQVRNRLKQGYRVLFSGVPCQIAALYAFLDYNRGKWQNLYTIEVICHGVPTNELHRTALQKTHSKRIVSYRTKVNGSWLKGNIVTYEKKDGTICTMESHLKDFLFRSYLTFSVCRNSCYSCHYAKTSRISDLTIGDFWGYEKSANANMYKNESGISAIFPNTEKGQMMINGKDLHIVDCSWAEIIPMNQNMYMPTNSYDYILSDYIYVLKYLPLSIKGLIYQKGFSAKYPNRILNKLMSILFYGKRKEQQNIKQILLKESLKELDK